ncbi:BrnA antitoxin family protein [Escherichia coli]|nr:BrnA antitoxin family protein [Escherichia coli]
MIDGFRATGPGWQGRIDTVLRDWLGAQRGAPKGTRE